MQIYWNKKKAFALEKSSTPTGLVFGHPHGQRFMVLGHQYGRRDVMRKHSIKNYFIFTFWYATTLAVFNRVRSR